MEYKQYLEALLKWIVAYTILFILNKVIEKIWGVNEHFTEEEKKTVEKSAAKPAAKHVVKKEVKQQIVKKEVKKP